MIFHLTLWICNNLMSVCWGGCNFFAPAGQRLVARGEAKRNSWNTFHDDQMLRLLLYFLFLLQATEQYCTCSQSLAHFLRQVNRRWQALQVFTGRWDFLVAMLDDHPLPFCIVAQSYC